MKSGKRRILFVYKEFSHFVRKDFETLSKSSRLIKVRSPFGKSPLSFLSVGLKQFFVLIWYIWRSDVIFCWFADYHSLLPALFSRLTGKRLYLVLGGYDVTHVEELGYGSFNKKFRGFCARYSMCTATLNLPVAKALGMEARERVGDVRIQVLPTGYDPEIYLPSFQKEDIILTVSLTNNWQRIMVKGIDRFVELAGKLPSIQFVLIGMEKDAESLIKNKPSNLLLLPPVDHKELFAWYGKSRFYAQFSRSEGLPNAVCEAMLRNCIPLGIRTGGIPEAIGDAGIVLDQWDPDLMAEQIRSCREPDLMAQRAREHTIRHFHIDRREQAITEIFNR